MLFINRSSQSRSKKISREDIEKGAIGEFLAEEGPDGPDAVFREGLRKRMEEERRRVAALGWWRHLVGDGYYIYGVLYAFLFAGKLAGYFHSDIASAAKIIIPVLVILFWPLVPLCFLAYAVFNMDARLVGLALLWNGLHYFLYYYGEEFVLKIKGYKPE